MAFYAKNFVYAGISSEIYNLQIANIDGGGTTNGVGSGDVTIIEKYIYKKNKPFFYGIYYDKKQ